MNAGLLSESRSTGKPYIGMIFSHSFLTTAPCLVGKASAHPEKVSTKTNKYLYNKYPYRPAFSSVKLIPSLFLVGFSFLNVQSL